MTCQDLNVSVTETTLGVVFGQPPNLNFSISESNPISINLQEGNTLGVSMNSPEQININLESFDLSNINHQLLINLDYENAGHTGFQATLSSGIGISIIDNTINLDYTNLSNFNNDVGFISNWVQEDTIFSFNGEGGNTYFKYNSNLNKLELYVNGILKARWG